MKTFKIFLTDYQTENIQAENFAVDDHNNLVVGTNLFHTDAWRKILFLYDDVVYNPNAANYEPMESTTPYNPQPPFYNEGVAESQW